MSATIFFFFLFFFFSLKPILMPCQQSLALNDDFYSVLCCKLLLVLGLIVK